jgi:tetratricopeptide (TPR) repeat protein
VQRHRYSDALAAYNELIRKGTPEPSVLAERGTVYLCLEAYEHAAADFEKANDLELRDPAGRSAQYLMDLATALWMLDRTTEAMSLLTQATEGITDGTITYTDLAGGVSQGLLLWYTAISLQDDERRSYSMKFLDRLARKSRIRSWPGPVAVYALRRTEFVNVLRYISDGDIQECISAARENHWKRRQLTKALFYAAVRDRDDGKAGEALTHMRLCQELENPILENEWYLARHEVRRREQK